MNKKGAALALVIVIFVALTLMVGTMFVIANASISSADSGMKAREAYFASRSGVEYIKSKLDVLIDTVEADMQAELDNKENNPDYVLPTGITETKRYGYGDNVAGFQYFDLSVPNPTTRPEFKDARVQLELTLTEERSFEITVPETGAGNYKNIITIEATSTGRSDRTSGITNVFSDLFEKGIALPLPKVYSDKHDLILLAYGGADPGDDPDDPGDPYIIPETGGIPTDYISWESLGSDLPWNAPRGTTFYSNGNYYIVYTPINYNAETNNGNGPDDIENVIKINPGTAQDVGFMSSFDYSQRELDYLNQTLISLGGQVLTRGDKVTYQGKYYVFVNMNNEQEWILFPSDPGAYAIWLEIPE